MSHLNDFITQATDQDALIRALCRMNFIKEQIKIFNQPQTINGYHSTDNKVGHIIIRSEHTKIPSDIGWEKKQGVFVGHVDAFQYAGNSTWPQAKTVYDEIWHSKLYTYYNIEKSKMALEARGLSYTEVIDTQGRIQLRSKFTVQATSKIKVRS